MSFLKDSTLLRQSAYINGAWAGADSGRSFPVSNPATGVIITQVADCGAAETGRAIAAAEAALPGWRAKTAAQRGAILRRWNDLILENVEDLALLMTLEQGKPLAESLGEVRYGASFIEWFAEEGRRIYGDVIPPHAPNLRVLVFKEPGGVMATYILFGVKAEYLIAASIMAAPGALAIAKIMYPETEVSETKGVVKLKVGKEHSNIVDAISAGCSDGLKVGMNVLAMLIGFLALIALINFLLLKVGGTINYIGLTKDVLFGWDPCTLSLDTILGALFSVLAWTMGVPWNEAPQAGALMGTKLVAN